MLEYVVRGVLWRTLVLAPRRAIEAALRILWKFFTCKVWVGRGVRRSRRLCALSSLLLLARLDLGGRGSVGILSALPPVLLLLLLGLG